MPNSLWTTLRQRFHSQRERGLARLTPQERAEIAQFDAAVRRHTWRYAGIAVGVWLTMAVIAKLAVAQLGWTAALVLSGVMFAALSFALAAVWFGPSRARTGLKSMAVVVGLAVSGAVLGGFLGRLITTGSIADVMESFTRAAPQILIGGLVTGMVFAVMMVSVAQYRRSQLMRQNAELARQAGAERMGRQLADAKLKLMQAQVEPHFLFNTLASVQQLAEGRAPEAAAMTAQLIKFLRAGLAGLREESSTLEREFAAIGAYLDIMTTRMGDRLRYELVLPAELRGVAVPPAMLISLVENAIKHGIEPALEPALLRVEATAGAAGLQVVVADTGIGPNTRNAGGGVGLDNIRQRLRILYAGRATLTVRANEPHGFHATITLPNDTHGANEQNRETP
ncbi:MAG: histidine kinase [Betaproteobacteria bacterium]|nr:histidine kinase [Betaproteobacteria bacterium]